MTVSARGPLAVATLLLGLFAAVPCSGRDCSVTSTGLVPLMDLEGAAYLGMDGGLYPGGTNEPPAAHLAAGLAAVGELRPLDTAGAPDPVHGRVVAAVLGFSNASMEAESLVVAVRADSARNPWIDLVNCAASGQTADRIADPDRPYWELVTDSLEASGYSPAQLQVVLLKLTIANPDQSFDEFTEAIAGYGETIVGIIRARYPNVRLIHLWSRSYAGYAGYPVPQDSLNPEPWAYWSAYGVKKLIARQLVGSPGLALDGAACGGAPWLGWGAYLWADGLSPRSDGLTWECDDFGGDGVHPSDAGRAKAADQWLRLLRGGDPVAASWYSAAWQPRPGSEPAQSAGTLTGALYSVRGRLRAASVCIREEELAQGFVWRRPDIPAGVYFLRPARPAAARRIVVVH